MIPRKAPPLALLAIALGCGGKAATDSHSSSAGTASAAAAAGIGDPAGSAGGTIGGIVSPDDASVAPIADAGPTPDADASISDSDAACIATGLCSVAPTDTACDVDSDCRTLLVPACDPVAQIIGVSIHSSVSCATPKCAPADGGCFQCEFEAQDCRATPDLGSVGVHCILHQCRTSLVGCSSCLAPK
jgi:hypothetical protein